MYILTISRSSWVSRSLPCTKTDCLLILNCYSFVCRYMLLIRSRSHIKVKVTYQGQGHTSRSRSNQGYFKGEMPLLGWFAFESNAFLLNIFLEMLVIDSGRMFFVTTLIGSISISCATISTQKLVFSESTTSQKVQKIFSSCLAFIILWIVTFCSRLNFQRTSTI